MTSSELLEHLLIGNKLLPEHIDELLQKRVIEDLHLDYKHGKELENKASKKSALEIREWVSGFANAEGGVLIIGISEPPEDEAGETKTNGLRKVTGCSNRSFDGSLHDWAARSLGPLASYLRPQAVIQVVEHGDGEILCIAVARAPNLVPCVVAGKIRHFLRIGDQTLEIDPYLYADLVLGRRQRPRFRLDGFVMCDPPSAHGIKVKLSLDLENESLAWANDLRAGIIGHLHGSRGQDPFNSLPRFLKQMIACEEHDGSEPYIQELSFKTQRMTVERLPPLCKASETFDFTILVPGKHMAPMSMEKLRLDWSGAIYVLSSNSEVAWWQINIELNYSPKSDDGVRPPSLEEDRKEVRRVDVSRPRVCVSWGTP